MRHIAFLVLVLAAACSIPERGDINITIVEPPAQPDADTDDTLDTDTTTVPDVIEPSDTDVPEYNGESAVLEGWMSSQGVQYAEPGNVVDMGWWTFSLESFDGLGHSATIKPTSFHFTVEADGDGRFGTPVDQAKVLASDSVDYCWLVRKDSVNGRISVAGSSNIGGPVANTMTGGSYEVFTVSSFPARKDLEMGMRCALRDDAPLGTKVAVSMDYTLTQGIDVYDASVARRDNVGVLPQYFVQVGPDSCGNYDMRSRYNVSDVSCSIPVMSFNTTGQSYPDSRDWFEMMGTWNILDGVGAGVVVNDLAVEIEFDRVIDFDSTTILTMDSPSLPGQWDTVQCTPAFDSFLGVSVLWCQAGAVDYTVTPQMRGFNLNMRISGLPTEVVQGVHMDVTTYFRWTDLATEFTTSDRGGYPVIDSDFQKVSPYHYAP